MSTADLEFHSADDPALVIEQRVRELKHDLGRSTEARLLELTIERIERRESIALQQMVRVVASLDSAGQRAALSELLRQAETASGSIEADEFLKFRLINEGRECYDSEVVGLVDRQLSRALAARGTHTQSRDKHFDIDDARVTMLQLKSVFSAHQKRFFLDRGTLLGAIRQQGFISNDYDIDVGIFGDEVSLDEVKTMFADTDFTVNQDYSYKVGLLSANGIQVDIFLTTRENGYFLSKGAQNNHRWYFSPFDLIEFPFLGEKFFVPAQYEKHLDENYGNWRHPAIFYDLSYDEPCVDYGDGAYSVSYLARRMSQALRTGQRFLAEAPAKRLRDRFGVDFTDWFPKPVGDLIKPHVRPQYEPVPIFVIENFSVFTSRLRRLVESALSITPAVILCVDESAGDVDNQRLVAESVDRVAGVRSVPDASWSSIAQLMEWSPRSIVVPNSAFEGFPPASVSAASDQGCEVLPFGTGSVCLTLDGSGRVTVRTTPASQR